MSSSAQTSSTSWNTQESRPWNKPQLKNQGTVTIHDETRCIPGINEFDMANSKNLRVKAYCDPKKDGAFPVHIDSWYDSIFYSAGVCLLDVCDCDRDMEAGTWSAEPVTNPKPLQEFSGAITFARTFSSAPTVIVWLTGWDLKSGTNFRVKAEALDVTPTGFTLRIATWSDSVLYWGAASWVAHYADCPRIKSGSYSTSDGRPWNKPQLEDEGVVKFAGTPFPRAPYLFVAVNEFDIAGTVGTSCRFRATVSDLTKEGFEWHLDSWFDTVKYSLRASYLALEVGSSSKSLLS